MRLNTPIYFLGGPVADFSSSEAWPSLMKSLFYGLDLFYVLKLLIRLDRGDRLSLLFLCFFSIMGALSMVGFARLHSIAIKFRL